MFHSPHKPVTRRVVGLDLGKAVDFTALVDLEWTWPPPGGLAVPKPVYNVTALKRWPLGTSYVALAGWLARYFASPAGVNSGGPPPVLVVDETGVGIAVIEMIRERLLAAQFPGGLVCLTITAGSGCSVVDTGRWRVAKKQLASVLVTLFQERRLALAQVPERDVLIREAQTFSVKVTPAGNETFESWRENEHDDLVLALALACWSAENLVWSPWPPEPLPRGYRT